MPAAAGGEDTIFKRCRFEPGSGNQFLLKPPNPTKEGPMSPHVLALDVAGAPHRWINVRQAAHYYATDMIAWAIGAHEFVLRGGMQRSTGIQSMIRASSIIAIKG